MSTILEKLALYKDHLDSPVVSAIRSHETSEYVLRVRQFDGNDRLLEWLVLLDTHYTLHTCPDGAIEVEFHKDYLITMPHPKDVNFGDTLLCMYSRNDNMINTGPLATKKLNDYIAIVGADQMKLQINLPKRLVFPPF